MADAVVLDTTAILTLTGNEPGAGEVQTYLHPRLPGWLLSRQNCNKCCPSRNRLRMRASESRSFWTITHKRITPGTAEATSAAASASSFHNGHEM